MKKFIDKKYAFSKIAFVAERSIAKSFLIFLTLRGKLHWSLVISIRMQRAVQLPEKNEMTVAKDAYEVGFNNPKYFSKFFKQAYNAIPSSYPEGKKKEVPK